MMTKEVLMMVMAGCPHCVRARQMMAELCETHPEYATVQVKIVDETIEKEFAASLDYYYVPTFFVAGEKVHEGRPTLEAIERVFQAALASI
jgi:glutaredoxin